ncbi:MAG: phosphotransferase [Alphaproteobacteria bacterium]
MHGDVSPKNILIGPAGPVFLDAECAWYGDPAFDIAFCLNHLLLKCLWTPAATGRFLACFRALAEAWLAEVDWEPRAVPGAGGDTAAGADLGAGRRQVAGRVPDRHGRQGVRARDRPGADRGRGATPGNRARGVVRGAGETTWLRRQSTA